MSKFIGLIFFAGGKLMMPVPSELTVSRISRLLKEGSAEEDFIQLCQADPRQGVRSLALAYARQNERDVKEQARLEKLFEHEQEVWKRGFNCIAGIDEVGRGPLAGPVVAGAVVLPGKLILPGLKDSKLVPERKRNELAREIRQKAVAWGIGIASVEEIDRLNILGATKLAMVRAVESLGIKPEYLLIDALKLASLDIPQSAIINGDALSASIAAASILAKVYRDNLMEQLHQDYPHYNFASNKGYLTAEHARSLDLYGPCSLHRTSFAPVRTVWTGKTTV
jgi:ribonuclease HII